MPKVPKRRRLLTPLKKKANTNKQVTDETKELEVSTPRGRLKGALLDALEPVGDDSDVSLEPSPIKRESIRRYSLESRRERKYTSSDDERPHHKHSPQRQSYVLKLFDRSVDLSQFEEDSPLYPICRAWIVNQPKANYSRFGKRYDFPMPTEDSVELPGPEGPPISRIPPLLPEQEASNKDNINLNYPEAEALPARERLLRAHAARWAGVRRAWAARAARVEARYDASQQLLNRINVNAM